jgi:N-acetylglucosamine-6-sulfatase
LNDPVVTPRSVASTPGRTTSCGRHRNVLFALLALLAACGIGAGSAATSARSAPAKPNFLVVMTDDQTVGELSVMSQTKRLIADQGVTFDRFITSYPLCCPSRTTFLTGQYSHNHGVLGNGTPIGGYPAFDKNDTLASWLQNDGYHTIQIGKFLNGYPLPGDKTEVPPGWNEWFACLDSSENNYFDYTLNQNGTLHHYGSAPSDYKTDVYGDIALNSLRQRAALGTSGQPWFMFLAFTAPHLPAHPAPRDRGRFRHRPLAKAKSFNEANVSDKPRFIRKLPRFTSAKVRKITRAYRARLETLLSVDRVVGRLVGELRSDGMLNDTYIVFMSDNGFLFGQHRLAKGKYVAYEGSSRTPTLMRGPGLPSGAHSKALVANVDMAPTLVELAGATPTVTMDGSSLLPYATDPHRTNPRPVLLEANTKDDPSPGLPYTGIETQRYKYIHYRDGEEELYDLKRDPGELRSRHHDPHYRRTKRALAARLAQLRICSGASCNQPTGPIPGPR